MAGPISGRAATASGQPRTPCFGRSIASSAFIFARASSITHICELCRRSSKRPNRVFRHAERLRQFRSRPILLLHVHIDGELRGHQRWQRDTVAALRWTRNRQARFHIAFESGDEAILCVLERFFFRLPFGQSFRHIRKANQPPAIAFAAPACRDNQTRHSPFLDLQIRSRESQLIEHRLQQAGPISLRRSFNVVKRTP